MCGIIAVVGSADASRDLVTGLTLLEYRGYDSTGLAVHTPDGIVRVRSVGDVASLTSCVSKRSGLTSVSTGIAHTRWATHGGVTEANAHPHRDPSGLAYVVHNGIIENADTLKQSLPHSVYASQTDTEVIAHLIAHERKNGATHTDALKATITQLQGQYAIAVMYVDDPQTVYVATYGSPLMLGNTETGCVIASDTRALVGATEYARIPDAVYGSITADTCKLYTHAGDEVTSQLIFSAVIPEAGDGSLVHTTHYFSKEMHEIPQAITAAMAGRHTPAGAVFPELSALESHIRNASLIRIIGCGTALYAGFVSKNAFHALMHIPVDVESASEFRRRYYTPQQGEIVITLSQSGETADTVGALEKAREYGVPTIAIVNVQESTLARKADAVIACRAGREVSVASTKAFMAHSVILTLFGIAYTKNERVAREVLASLTVLQSATADVLTQTKYQNLPLFHDREKVAEMTDFAKAVDLISRSSHVFTIGRLSNAGAAKETALKLKEVCYIHAEAQEAGELKHGSLALIDDTFPTIAFLSDSPAGEKTLSAIQEVRARNGVVIAVGPASMSKKANATYAITVPRVHPFLQAILNVVPMYMLTYAIALQRGLPIDKPRNLAKAVTVE